MSNKPILSEKLILMNYFKEEKYFDEIICQKFTGFLERKSVNQWQKFPVY